MIKKVVLKTSIPALGRRAMFSADDGVSFAVQSGLLVIRQGDTVHSVPLSDVSVIEGCPAAAPKRA